MLKKSLPFFPLLLLLILTACAALKPSASAPLSSQTATQSSGSVVLLKSTPAETAPTVQAFVQQTAQSDGFSAASLTTILSQAQYQPQIIAMMNKPNEQALTWYQYQSLFITPSLVAKGVTFARQNRKALTNAAKQFGVPSDVILGILGVETHYGEQQGGFRALDALYTLAFYYPRRALYFQAELEAYLSLTHDSGFDPLALKSSYAGALGMPQFMPSTYREYAVSTTNASPNLFANPADVIGSVANYLAKMGWTTGAPVAVPATLAKGVTPTDAMQNGNLSVSALRKRGVYAARDLNGNLPADLIVLQGQDGPEYWLAFHNFYVIKRYNASTLYAMTVYQLGKKVKANLQ